MRGGAAWAIAEAVAQATASVLFRDRVTFSSRCFAGSAETNRLGGSVPELGWVCPQDPCAPLASAPPSGPSLWVPDHHHVHTLGGYQGQWAVDRIQ